MITFEFKSEPRCHKCRHNVSSTVYRLKNGELHRVQCAFKESQIGHVRVPKWCPKYRYLHDGVKDES